MATQLLGARSEIEVSCLLPEIKARTLVLHAVKEQAVPVAEGLILAQHIADAECVLLDSRNHFLINQEPAWEKFKLALLDFFAEGDVQSARLRAKLSTLSQREREILMQIAEAKSNPEIATALNISEKTVRNHASNLFAKLGLKSRSEAILYIHRLS